MRSESLAISSFCFVSPMEIAVQSQIAQRARFLQIKTLVTTDVAAALRQSHVKAGLIQVDSLSEWRDFESSKLQAFKPLVVIWNSRGNGHFQTFHFFSCHVMLRMGVLRGGVGVFDFAHVYKKCVLRHTPPSRSRPIRRYM